MLTLQSHIKLTKEVIDSPNLCSSFSDQDLSAIGDWCWTGYSQDKQSRAAWERRTSAAMDLAMQVMKTKNFPWPNCANIAFPLVTIAALQFHARAYPAVVGSTDVVRCRVIGEDLDGAKKAKADRIACHMSYQVMEQDQSWEEQHDRLLINLPIVGCAFKKSHYDARSSHNKSELVLARDLVMNYYAKSVESCGRKTHIIPKTRNDIYEQVKRGTFRNVLEMGWYTSAQLPPVDPQQAEKNRRIGMQPPATPDETTPLSCLEQHCSVDLDGDGYAEPYIITIEETSKCVLRIVARVDREEDIEREDDGTIISIRAMEYFTKYSFVPAPDGGIYDIGFGLFLGPLNEQVNTICNQLTDAGTMANSAGFFLGRGAKIRGGIYTFVPFGAQRIDSTGDDIRKNIFPIPVREPSMVLFQLLQLLINYANRVSGSTDVMVGENIGQNTPAETGRTMVEQGQKIYSSIFKRVWRGMKDEFKKLYLLNALYLPTKAPFGSGKYGLRSDYLGNPDDVCPAADPNVTSDAMAYNQMMAVKQSAAATPGYNGDAVERAFLKSLKVDAIDVLFPGSDKLPPGVNPKVQIEQMKIQQKQLELKAKTHMFAAELMAEQQVNNATILKLQADAIKAMADIEGDKEDRQINALNTAIGALKHRNEVIAERVRLLLEGMEHDRDTRESGVGGMESPPMQPSAAPMGAESAAGLAGAMG